MESKKAVSLVHVTLSKCFAGVLIKFKSTRLYEDCLFHLLPRIQTMTPKRYITVNGDVKKKIILMKAPYLSSLAFFCLYLGFFFLESQLLLLRVAPNVTIQSHNFACCCSFFFPFSQERLGDVLQGDGEQRQPHLDNAEERLRRHSEYWLRQYIHSR